MTVTVSRVTDVNILLKVLGVKVTVVKVADGVKVTDVVCKLTHLFNWQLSRWELSKFSANNKQTTVTVTVPSFSTQNNKKKNVNSLHYQ